MIAAFLARRDALEQGAIARREKLNADQQRNLAEAERNRAEQALRCVQYTAITRMRGADATLISQAYLRLGQLLDISGDHPAAVDQYGIVLAREDVFDSHRNAKRYNEKPFTKEINKTGTCPPAP